MRYGGLGLRSAIRAAPAAYWASWMDCFPMLNAGHLNAAERFLAALEQSFPSEYPSTQELQASAALLRAEGLLDQPLWADVARCSAAAPHRGRRRSQEKCGGGGRGRRRTPGSFILWSMPFGPPSRLLRGPCFARKVARMPAEYSQFFRRIPKPKFRRPK